MIVAVRLSRKRPLRFLIVAARQLGVRGDCRADWWPTGAAFAVEGSAAAIAFDVHFEDGGVVNEAIDDGERHRLIGEDLAPFAERLVGGDEQGSPLIPGADEFKEHPFRSNPKIRSRVGRWRGLAPPSPGDWEILPAAISDRDLHVIGDTLRQAW